MSKWDDRFRDMTRRDFLRVVHSTPWFPHVRGYVDGVFDTLVEAEANDEVNEASMLDGSAFEELAFQYGARCDICRRIGRTVAPCDGYGLSDKMMCHDCRASLGSFAHSESAQLSNEYIGIAWLALIVAKKRLRGRIEGSHAIRFDGACHIYGFDKAEIKARRYDKHVGHWQRKMRNIARRAMRRKVVSKPDRNFLFAVAADRAFAEVHMSRHFSTVKDARYLAPYRSDEKVDQALNRMVKKRLVKIKDDGQIWIRG